MLKYKIGNAAVYGNIVCKPSILTEVDEEYFYKSLNKSLTLNKL